MATDAQSMNAAVLAHERGQLADAEQLYRRVLATPDTAQGCGVEAAINLGALLRSQGRLQEGKTHYEHWLSLFHDNITLRLNGVNCLRELGDVATAQRWIAEGLQLDPEHIGLHQALARTLIDQADLNQAVAMLQQLCQKHQEDGGLWLDLGLALHKTGEPRQALEAFTRAAAAAPNDPRAAANRVTLLKELGELEQGEILLGSFPTDLRGHVDVRGAAALLAMEQQRMVEAEAELAALCLIAPGQALHWLNRAACLRSLKRYMAAARVLKQGLQWHPEHRKLQEALGQALAELGHQGPGLALLLQAAKGMDELDSVSLINLQFLGAGYRLIAAPQLASMAQTWETQQQQKGVGPLWPDTLRTPLHGRRLRVGYLSADLCNHPVGRFLRPVLEHHNRNAIEVWGLSCGSHKDAMQEHLSRHCDHWLDVRFGSDLEVARVIADQQLDVLVELGGYTGQSRLSVLVHRPAPVQLSYLGYFAPTYLRCVDGWLGDRALFAGLEAADQDAHQLLELDGGYMVYHDDQLPHLHSQSDRPFRFGSFNHSRKLTAATVELFCRVMEATPTAELLLKSISFVEAEERQRIQQLFTKAGLAPERLVLMPWVEGRKQHLDCYASIDVALDPLPYGGATTSCEALAMGVPLVSVAGAGMVGRLSASILVHSGHTQWLAEDADAYVGIAAELAAQGPRTTGPREQLRHAVQSSALADGRRLAKELERHYLDLAAQVRA
jgi:protein O-GlcNAc transferase